MKKQRKISAVIITITILGSLLSMSGCGTEEDNQKTKVSDIDNKTDNSIKETELENYEVNIKSIYIHNASGLGMGFQFEVKFENIEPEYEAYVCNDMSSLFDIKSAKENDKKIEENPEAYEAMLNGEDSSFDYKPIFYTKLEYDAGEKVDIDWTPHPTEENYSKYSSEEEYLKTGYVYLVLREEKNIIGFMVFEIPVKFTEERDKISYEEINVLEAVSFEKINGEYQNVSFDYVKSRVDNLLENK